MASQDQSWQGQWLTTQEQKRIHTLINLAPIPLTFIYKFKSCSVNWNIKTKTFNRRHWTKSFRGLMICKLICNQIFQRRQSPPVRVLHPQVRLSCFAADLLFKSLLLIFLFNFQFQFFDFILQSRYYVSKFLLTKWLRNRKQLYLS